MNKAARDKVETDLKMRRRTGYGVFVFLAAQMVVADIAFYLYGAFNDWNIPYQSMVAWLSATVVQVVGLALVIVRSLFPGGNGGAQ